MSDGEIDAGGPGAMEPPRRLSGAHVQWELHGVVPGAMPEASAAGSALGSARMRDAERSAVNETTGTAVVTRTG